MLFCPKCKEPVEMGDAGTISNTDEIVPDKNIVPDKMSVEWFCETCNIGGTVEYKIDLTSLTTE